MLTAAETAVAAPPPSDAPPSAPARSAPVVPPADEALAAKRAEAAAHWERGRALLGKQQWGAALAEFLESRRLYPTRSATSSAAVCLKNLDRFDESLEMFETLLKEFAETLPADVKTTAQQEVVALRERVGTISIEGAEPGAALVIDGHARGEYPSLTPLRVAVGSHIVRVYKEDFEPFETRVDVAGGQVVRVNAKLRALSASGRLRVIEREGKALEVIVDGVAVGVTPWDGRLGIGRHVVFLRGAEDLGTMPAVANIKAREVANLTLAAEPLQGRVLIDATPAGAVIAVNAVEVARGLWEGRLQTGPQRIEVAAEGFRPVSREVILEPGRRQVIKIALERDPGAALWRKPSKFVVEATGSLGIAPVLGGDVQGSCAGGCSGPVGLGVLGAAYGGYELGSGVGFGITAGYLFAERTFRDRPVEALPMGLPSSSAKRGSADETLRLTGLMLGAAAGLRFGERAPITARVGVGGLFGRIGDARRARFPLGDSTSFEANEIVDTRAVNDLYFAPEAKIGLRLSDHLEGKGARHTLALVRQRESRKGPLWLAQPGACHDDPRQAQGAA